jgi:hypothetical protein
MATNQQSKRPATTRRSFQKLRPNHSSKDRRWFSSEEKPYGLVWKIYELKMPVKASDCFVDRVDHNSRSGNLRGLRQRPLKRIDEQKLPEPLPFVILIDGEASQERDWHDRIR